MPSQLETATRVMALLKQRREIDAELVALRRAMRAETLGEWGERMHQDEIDKFIDEADQ